MKKQFLVVLLCAFFLCTCVSACSLLGPKENRDAYAEQMQVIAVETKAATDAVQDIKDQIQAVREQAARGEIDLNTSVTAIAGLADKLTDAYQHVSEVKQAGITIKAEADRQRQSGSPWWQIALNIGLGVASTVATGGWLSSFSWGRTIENGARVLINAIEGGATQAEIKKKVMKENNFAVQKLMGMTY